MLMRLFFEAFASRRKSHLHFLEFMQTMHARLHAVRKRGTDDALRRAADGFSRNTDLLCLDDVRIDDIADAMIVGRLFARLFDTGVIVCATSNARPHDLYPDGLNRHLFMPFADLMDSRTQVIELGGPIDYRGERMAGRAHYLTPINKAAREEIDRIWVEVSDGCEPGLTLELSGRQLRLHRFHAGALRADFSQLCEEPLGPPDFLAIADKVRILLLEGVPRFESQNRDAARRFTLLIDALYEARVRLVITAAARPDRLHGDARGALEFRRTASRLKEMCRV